MGDLHCAWIKYCDTTIGDQVANREHKPYPDHRGIAVLTAELRWFVFDSLQHRLSRLGSQWFSPIPSWPFDDDSKQNLT